MSSFDFFFFFVARFSEQFSVVHVNRVFRRRLFFLSRLRLRRSLPRLLLLDVRLLSSYFGLLDSNGALDPVPPIGFSLVDTDSGLAWE